MSRVRTLCWIGDDLEQPPEDAAAPGAEPLPGHVEPPEGAPADMDESQLKKRAEVMFSGETGAPVALGEGAAAKTPTFC